jgi:hypothetical protein
LLAEVAANGDRCELVFAIAELTPDLQRLLTYGLDETVGAPEEPTVRKTKPSEPEFLSRLSGMLRRRGGFEVSIQDEPDRPLRLAAHNSGVRLATNQPPIQKNARRLTNRPRVEA